MVVDALEVATATGAFEGVWDETEMFRIPGVERFSECAGAWATEELLEPVAAASLLLSPADEVFLTADLVDAMVTVLLAVLFPSAGNSSPWRLTGVVGVTGVTED